MKHLQPHGSIAACPADTPKYLPNCAGSFSSLLGLSSLALILFFVMCNIPFVTAGSPYFLALARLVVQSKRFMGSLWPYLAASPLPQPLGPLQLLQRTKRAESCHYCSLCRFYAKLPDCLPLQPLIFSSGSQPFFEFLIELISSNHRQDEQRHIPNNLCVIRDVPKVTCH